MKNVQFRPLKFIQWKNTNACYANIYTILKEETRKTELHLVRPGKHCLMTGFARNAEPSKKTSFRLIN